MNKNEQKKNRNLKKAKNQQKIYIKLRKMKKIYNNQQKIYKNNNEK